MTHLVMAALLALAQNDKTQANAYDDAWEAGWKAHCRTVLSGGSGKTTGLVLQVGDSITHANPYSQWPRSGAGKTGEDDAVCVWSLATVGFPATMTDPTSVNGFYLAVADTSGTRGMTASGGIDTSEFLSGNGNGGTMMPSDTTQSSARTKVADGTSLTGYTGNIQITTLANAFSNAQFAVLMLGTNDFSGGRSVSAFIADLTTIINTLEGKNIAVVLSTIPPRFNPGPPAVVVDVTPYNTAIRNLAQSIGLPLIDYYAEILSRRSGTTWENTLISSDGVHPTGAAASANPYNTPTGDASVHKTGSNCANDGYLLRSWLTMQKLKEVKSYVIDDAPIPGGGGGGGGGGTPPSSGGCGLTGLEAVILLALLAACRKSGF